MAHDTHEHYHPPGLQHQFEDMGQQAESDSIGMWMFLVQEIMFFGGLFTVYLVFRSKFPMAFAAGSNHLDVFWGTANTLVLIISSLTMALAVHYAQLGKRNLQLIFIIATMVLGTVFLGVKAIEYTNKYYEGIVPIKGLNLKTPKQKVHSPATTAEEHAPSDPDSENRQSLDSPASVEKKAGEHNEEEYVNPTADFVWEDTHLAQQAQQGNYLTSAEKIGYFSNGEIDPAKFRDKVRIFFWIYFAMTGLHALHMIIGLGIMLWLYGERLEVNLSPNIMRRLKWLD